VTDTGSPRPRRLDERVEPGWASLSEALLKYGGLAVGAVLLWLGIVTGGFFIVLAVALAGIAAIGGWLLGSYVGREGWYTRRNARSLTAIIVIASPILLIVGAQLLAPVLTPAPGTVACFGATIEGARERTEAISVDPRIETMELRLTVSPLAGGAAHWFLRDPSGVSRWSGRTDEPAEVVAQPGQPLDASGGAWEFHFVSEGGGARYALVWRGYTAGEKRVDLGAIDCQPL
jgi:hypothetical protein